MDPVPRTTGRLDGLGEERPQRRVWLVVGDKLGDNAQVEIVADALGWPVERRTLRFLPRYITGKPPFKASLYHVDLQASDSLSPPWPDLVLTVGRRPSMAAMWIRQQSSGGTKVVIVGRPRRMLRQFDLVLATPQYRLPERENVLRLDLPLMRIDPKRIAAGTAAWREKLAALPRPLTAVLVGGPTKPFVFDAAVARTFLDSLRKTCGEDGTLFITTSRRTPAPVIEALESGLPPGGCIFRWRADVTDNPYQGLLGLADRFVVTGDSVSMLVEVARVGKPLAIFALPVAEGIWHGVKTRLADLFQPAPGDGRAGPLVRLGDTLYDLGIVGYSREFEAVHGALIDGGFAVRLGQPFATPKAQPPDDVPRVVQRIHTLFNDR
ncbi:MAG: mitochondrial fission ELM1 family protein [Rhodospirillales bacterium]|nr:mitochondrial fission ELM1 family protein [Rhodospirillales bacterium]